MGTSTSKKRVFAAQTTPVLLLKANAARQGATIQNLSTAYLYLSWDDSPADPAVAMPPGSYYETPFNYTGPIMGVWSAVNGRAVVTELP